MNHEEAVRVQAPERYLLGEFSDEERDQFEEHFFTCSHCADEVRTGALFEANARAVFADERRAIPSRRAASKTSFLEWLRWMPLRPAFAGAMAVVALVVFSGYQMLVQVPDLRSALEEARSPQAAISFQPLAASRGEDHVVEIPADRGRVGILIERPRRLSFPKYRCELRNSTGSQVFSIEILDPGPSSLSLDLSVPADRLETGQYALTLYGLQPGDPSRSEKIETYDFTVKRR